MKKILYTLILLLTIGCFFAFSSLKVNAASGNQSGGQEQQEEQEEQPVRATAGVYYKTIGTNNSRYQAANIYISYASMLNNYLSAGNSIDLLYTINTDPNNSTYNRWKFTLSKDANSKTYINYIIPSYTGDTFNEIKSGNFEINETNAVIISFYQVRVNSSTYNKIDINYYGYTGSAWQTNVATISVQTWDSSYLGASTSLMRLDYPMALELSSASTSYQNTPIPINTNFLSSYASFSIPNNTLIPQANDFNYIICKEFTEVWQRDTSGGDYGSKLITFETASIKYHFWLFPSVEELRVYTESNSTLTLLDTYAYNNDSYLCFIYDKVSGGNYLEFGICEARFNTTTNSIYYYKIGGDDDIVNNTEITSITFNDSAAGIFQDANYILSVEQIPPRIADYTDETIYTYGYDNGYTAGLEGENGFSPFWNVLAGIFTSLGSIFAVELVPHVPIGLFFMVPLFFIMLGFIMWIWRGKQ